MDKATPTQIKTFVFLDLETSSLLAMERPKIIEISLVAVHRDALLWQSKANDAAVSRRGAGTDLPRVADKLTLCVYPNKQVSEKSFELTKLDNHNLSQSRKKILDVEAATMLKLFVSRQEGPVCLVAHNGDRFDFRLLRTELLKLEERLEEDILCADSLRAYAETGEDGVVLSYSLAAIYGRVCGGGAVPGAHSAEADVVALIRIMLTRAEVMCRWMDNNAIPFNETELYYIPSPQK